MVTTTARRAFLKALDVPAVEEAIRRAERETTGELRVSIAGYFRGDPQRLAARAFRRLHMDVTRDRNGVLILIAPARRRVVVLGDEGIHARVGDPFWRELADRLSAALRGGDATAALLQAIEAVGAQLARQFPADGGSPGNELPDELDIPRS